MLAGALSISVDATNEEIDIDSSAINLSSFTDPRVAIVDVYNHTDTDCITKVTVVDRTEQTTFSITPFEDGHHTIYLIAVDEVVPVSSPKGFIVYDASTEKFYVSLIENADFNNSEDWAVATADDFIYFATLVDAKGGATWLGDYTVSEYLALLHTLNGRDAITYKMYNNCCAETEEVNLNNWLRLETKLQGAQAKFTALAYKDAQKLIESSLSIIDISCNSVCNVCN